MDDDVFDNFDMTRLVQDLPDQKEKEVSYDTCTGCSTKMIRDQNLFKCYECGLIKKCLDYAGKYSHSVIMSYNTDINKPMLLKITGTDSQSLHRRLRQKTQDYSKKARIESITKLDKQNSSTLGIKIQHSYLKEAAELYSTVRNCINKKGTGRKIVKRGDGLKGALTSCLGYVFKKYNQTQKATALSTFYSIPKKYITKFDKEMNSLCAQGKIDIPINHNETIDYVNQYFAAWSVHEKYKPFVTELICRSSQTDMKGKGSNKPSTKCAGVMYILMLQKPNFKMTNGQRRKTPVTRKEVEQKCSIVHATFRRFCSDVIIKNRDILKPVFQKHGIKCPRDLDGLRAGKHAKKKYRVKKKNKIAKTKRKKSK